MVTTIWKLLLMSWAYWECLRILFIMQSYIKIIENKRREAVC